MSVLDEATATRVQHVLIDQRVNGGRRLGLIVTFDDDAAGQAAASLLEASGLPPLRRLARLRPRHGEQRVRPSDLTDFVRHYGHEYAAALLSRSVFMTDGERSEFEATSGEEGCDVHWHE